MVFTLRVIPRNAAKGDLVLEAETPLSGVEFVEAVVTDIRKCIDDVARHHHTTLGALAQYEMKVPQYLAMQSGLYESADTVTIVVENDLLSHFIFYKANVNYRSAGRRCYPYLENEATLLSLVDELKFLRAWADAGFADYLYWDGTKVVGGTLDDEDTSDDNNLGCDGCTCGMEHQHPQHRPDHNHKHPEHGHRPHHPGGHPESCGPWWDTPHCPPPPPPRPIIGNGVKPLPGANRPPFIV